MKEIWLIDVNRIESVDRSNHVYQVGLEIEGHSILAKIELLHGEFRLIHRQDLANKVGNNAAAIISRIVDEIDKGQKVDLPRKISTTDFLK